VHLGFALASQRIFAIIWISAFAGMTELNLSALEITSAALMLGGK
jgi:hypothetical protein